MTVLIASLRLIMLLFLIRTVSLIGLPVLSAGQSFVLVVLLAQPHGLPNDLEFHLYFLFYNFNLRDAPIVITICRYSTQFIVRG